MTIAPNRILEAHDLKERLEASPLKRVKVEVKCSWRIGYYKIHITFHKLRSFHVYYDIDQGDFYIRCEGGAARLVSYIVSKFGKDNKRNKGVRKSVELLGTVQENNDWFVEAIKDLDFIIDLIYTKAK